MLPSMSSGRFSLDCASDHLLHTLPSCSPRLFISTCPRCLTSLSYRNLSCVNLILLRTSKPVLMLWQTFYTYWLWFTIAIRSSHWWLRFVPCSSFSSQGWPIDLHNPFMCMSQDGGAGQIVDSGWATTTKPLWIHRAARDLYTHTNGATQNYVASHCCYRLAKYHDKQAFPFIKYTYADIFWPGSV